MTSSMPHVDTLDLEVFQKPIHELDISEELQHKLQAAGMYTLKDIVGVEPTVFIEQTNIGREEGITLCNALADTIAKWLLSRSSTDTELETI